MSRQARIQERARARQARAVARAAAGTATPDLPGTQPPDPSHTPAGPFLDIHGRYLPLENTCRGASAFLILSGPSLTSLDLPKLRRRGIFTIGVNNSPALWRPNLWTYVDRANKFHQSIWLDPTIIKSVPRQHLHKELRRKLPDGTFEKLTRKLPDGSEVPAKVSDMPGVIGHVRNAYFNPDTWLSEESINWGNSRKSANKNGHPRILNVMLCVLKLAYAFGFRVVYLLGCDFSMDFARPYAFAQGKEAGGVNGNNHAYQSLNEMFTILKPRFDAAGFRVLNCNPGSGLTVFEFADYDSAVETATEGIPQSLDTNGWYD